MEEFEELGAGVIDPQGERKEVTGEDVRTTEKCEVSDKPHLDFARD